MTGFKVEADLTQGVSQVRKLGLTFEEVRKQVRGANYDLGKLTGEMQTAARGMEKLFQSYVRTPSARHLRTYMQQTGQQGMSVFRVEPTIVDKDKPNVFQASFHSGLRNAGLPMAPPQIPQGAQQILDNGGTGGGEGGGGGGAGAGGGGGKRPGFGASLWRGVKVGAGVALGAFGIASIAGAAGKSISQAQDYTVGLHNLRQSSGDLSLTFDQLDREVRDAGHGLNVTFTELSRMTREFRDTAHITDLRQGTGEARVAAGLAEAHGLDRERTAADLAPLRLYDAGGRGKQGARDLALLIGEAVAKAGGAPADQIISAVGRFVTGNVGQTINTPNVPGYLDLYTAMQASGKPGMRGASGENMLAQLDAGIRGGGGRGEASQVFMYRALGERDIYRSKYLQEEGAFGTRRSAFGSTGAGADTTNFQRLMNAFGNPKSDNYGAMDAIQGMLGVQNMHQARAISDLYQQMGGGGGFGQLGQQLRAQGLDLEKMNPESIGYLGKLAAGQGGDVMTAFRDRKDVSDDDFERLRKAIESGDLPGAAGVIGKYGTPEDTGKQTVTMLKDINNGLTSLGDRLLGPLNSIVLNTTSWLSKHWNTADMAGKAYTQYSEEERRAGRSPKGYVEFQNEFQRTHDDLGNLKTPETAPDKTREAIDADGARVIADRLATALTDALGMQLPTIGQNNIITPFRAGFGPDSEPTAAGQTVWEPHGMDRP